ncbi:hypothetical protein JVU11DRAFT_6470 [Chiua virens]|nr:hypothetical protein JVU11DRAFT_6470 [Chiua virens]
MISWLTLISLWWVRTESPDSKACIPLQSSLCAQDLSVEDDHHNTSSAPEVNLAQMITQTPAAPRSFNPYMTPVSNPRNGDHSAATPSTFNVPLTPTINIRNEIASDEGGSTNKGIGDLLQDTATSQGRLNYWYNKFMGACREGKSLTQARRESSHHILQNIFLKEQKEEIEREYDITKRRLDETEQRLREVECRQEQVEEVGSKTSSYRERVLRAAWRVRLLIIVYQGMDLGSLEDDEVSVDDPDSQEGCLIYPSSI